VKGLFFLSFFFLSSLSYANDCPKKIRLTLENNKVQTYCLLDKLKVSQSCYDQKEKCQLVKKVKDNPKLISGALSHAATQNPGSWACQQLGFKVVMAKTGGGSDVCTCENEIGESAICISLTY
jgi:hypothetical protein